MALRIVPTEAARSDVGTLVVLTRAPERGTAKTRLIPALGVEATYRLARAFVADTLALAAAGPWRGLVACTAAEAERELRRFAPAARFIGQADGDLGARIDGALRAALVQSRAAVLIGSDTPDLPRELIVDAFAALESADIALGPASDGGFTLIGVRRWWPGLFDSVEWSTDTVCARTLANAERLGCRVALVDEWADVDDVRSLAELARRLLGNDRAPATRAVLAALALHAEGLRRAW